MMYQIIITQDAEEDLKRLDRIIARRIKARLNRLSENIDNLSPQALSGDMKGLFRFRVGNYRAIYAINPKDHIITILFIGHRRDVYKTR